MSTTDSDAPDQITPAVAESTTMGAARLGLRANLAQFALLVAVNALVGGMLGQERTVLPLLAETEFGLAAYTSALTYILAFGLTKAAAGFAVGALLAGIIADLYGIPAAVWTIAALTAASGALVAVRMYETHPPLSRPPTGGRPASAQATSAGHPRG